MIGKKLLASALALAMSISTFTFAINYRNANLFGVSSLTANAEISGDYKYTVLDDGTIEISKYTGAEQYLTIPSSIDEIKVTSIGKNAFYNCSSLIKVTIPNGITTIGEHSFKSCKNLEDINISNTVTTIGRNAFYDCQNLKSIYISNNVKYIGDYAFHNCKSLESIELPNSLETLGKEVFFGCQSLTSVELPNSITTISYGLFDTCRNLKNVKLPNNITSIGDWAFHECNSLESIEIPSSVKSIGKDSFFDCSNIISISIPNGVTEIPKNAFYGCSRLTDINIPNTVTKIGLGAFHSCLNLTDITIPNSITQIGEKAFYDCPSLLSIKVPKSVESIGTYAFGYSRNGNTPIKITDYKLDCYPDTAAEQYAKENGFVYELVDDSEHTHNYISKVTKETTCTEDGIKTYTCECGDSYTEILKALGHKYVDTVVPPTTTEQGYTEHKCSVCGHSYKDSYTDPVHEETTLPGKINGQKNKNTGAIRFIVTLDLDDIYAVDTAYMEIKVGDKTTKSDITRSYDSYKMGGTTVDADAGKNFVISQPLTDLKKGDKVTVSIYFNTYDKPLTRTITIP